MKGFIEINKVCNSGKKVKTLIPVSTILAVYGEDGGQKAFIATEYNRKSIPFGEMATESYAEVLDKIAEATK